MRNNIDSFSRTNMPEPELLRIGKGPYNIAVDEVSNLVYVACKKSNTISIIDGNVNSIVRSLKVNSPHDMEIDNDRRKIYIIGDNLISVLDTTRKILSPDTNEPIFDTFDVRSNGRIALDISKDLIYLLNKFRFDRCINVLDIRNKLSLIKKININRDPADIVVGSKTSRIYLANHDSTITLVNPDQSEIIHEIGKPKDISKFLGMDSRCKKILVNESENRIYVLYTSLKNVPNQGYVFLITARRAPYVARSEVLAIYDSENYEPMNIIHCPGLNDFCINYLNSETYLVNPDEVSLMILDKDGVTSHSGILTEYGNILVSSQAIYLAPPQSPLQFGMGVNTHLHKLYIAINGSNGNYLLTYNLDEISL